MILKIIKLYKLDTGWDIELKEGGKIFAQQTNIALQATTCDWAFHIHADEVIHENDLRKIVEAIEQDNNNTDDFILLFYHFLVDYKYMRNSRRVHKNEGTYF